MNQYQKCTDVDMGFLQFQEWADEQLEPFGGRAFHYSLEDYGGYCPPYLNPSVKLPKYKDGSGGFIDFVPFVIQQIKEEIYELIKVILQNGKLNSCLEIGLGDFGGTHVLYSQFFKSVTTIEIEKYFITKFLNSVKDKKYSLLLKDSQLICERSEYLDKTNLAHEYDFIFIDGNHTYENCKNDYERYYDMVAPGGILALHDSRNEDLGSAQFINTLRDKVDMIDIWYPQANSAGISYYITKGDN